MTKDSHAPHRSIGILEKKSQKTGVGGPSMLLTQVIQGYSKKTHCSHVPNKDREGDGGKIRKKPNPLDGYIQLHTTLTLTMTRAESHPYPIIQVPDPRSQIPKISILFVSPPSKYKPPPSSSYPAKRKVSTPIVGVSIRLSRGTPSSLLRW